jgi:sensor histidine kinase YesM
MTQEELENIFSRSSNEDGKSSGIGLRNVKDRLDMYFGGKNKISAFSEKEKFFRIEISIELDQLQAIADEHNKEMTNAT